jgi:hypothetical protein
MKDRQYKAKKKDRQYNGQKKKDRQNNGHITHKTKDCVTRTHTQLPCFSFVCFYLIHL